MGAYQKVLPMSQKQKFNYDCTKHEFTSFFADRVKLINGIGGGANSYR